MLDSGTNWAAFLKGAIKLSPSRAFVHSNHWLLIQDTGVRRPRAANVCAHGTDLQLTGVLLQVSLYWKRIGRCSAAETGKEAKQAVAPVTNPSTVCILNGGKRRESRMARWLLGVRPR